VGCHEDEIALVALDSLDDGFVGDFTDLGIHGRGHAGRVCYRLGLARIRSASKAAARLNCSGVVGSIRAPSRRSASGNPVERRKT
jgi:hypothetical protein